MSVVDTGSQYIYVPQDCLRFDGVDQHIRMTKANQLSYPSSSFSICIGFKSTVQNDNEYIFTKTQWNIDTTAGGGYLFSVNAGNDSVISNGAYNDGKWHYMVATWDKSLGSDNIKLYFDGELDNSANCSYSTDAAGSDIALGGVFNIFNWAGRIDEFRFYSGAALSAGDVKKLSNRINITDNLAAYLKFDDREGTSMKEEQYDATTITVNDPTWKDRDIRCWNTRWDEGNWDVTIETFMDPCDRNYLMAHVTPGAVRELYNILGTPRFIDTTYSSSNSLIYEPISGYGLSGLREKRTIAVKNISDSFLTKDYFHCKIEGKRIDV